MPEPIARQKVPSDVVLCPNWVWANNSNVAVAKDRDWFQDYTPFVSRLPDAYGMNPTGAEVLGIGTVELMLRKQPNKSGRDNHHKLLLVDVLHVPTACCNFFGTLGDIDIFTGASERGTRGILKGREGLRVGYFHDKGLFFQLQLSGPPVGPSLLDDGHPRLLNAAWPDSERQRWEQHKQTIEYGVVPYSRGLGIPTSNPALYTNQEKAWLKKNYENEFKFLMIHGLSIYKDEDREEGRNILRAFVTDDDCEDEAYSPSSDDTDLEGHMADYAFSHEGLDWIAKHYGNSVQFMASFGLKFYDNEDQTEARQLLEEFMKDSS